MMALHGTKSGEAGRTTNNTATTITSGNATPNGSQTPKRRASHLLQRQEEEAVGSLYRLSNRPVSPRSQVEQEKRIRREIANSNERRRMQSINAGFNSLRTMLPKHDGEKLSKAAILHHTSEYIDTLEQEKTRLLAQHCQLKRVIGSVLNGQQDIEGLLDHQLVKRIKTEHNLECSNSDSSDEGIQCHASPGVLIETEPNVDEMRSELVEVRKAVDRERKLRMQLEEQVKLLESQLYPERVKEIAQQVQVKFIEGGSNVHSESEDAAAVASLVDDTIGETIEIETHSCPSSPSIPTTIVISAAPTQPLQVQTQSRVVHIPETTAKKGKRARNNSKNQPQPAAIALPIDVPFINGIGDVEDGGQTVTLQIIGPSSNDQCANMANGPRHNLETIVEAIRHLEGDHLFKDEENVTVVKQDYEGEEIITSEVEEVELSTTIEPVPTSTGRVKVVMAPSSRRQQVIQTRPGVIVAKNPKD